MDVHLSQPVGSAQQLCAWLQTAMPQYRFKTVGANVVLERSSWVGLAIAPKGNVVHLSGDLPPNPGARILLNALFPVGILPGIIAYLVFWLSVRGSWNALEKRVSAVLRGEQVAPEPVGADGKPIPAGPDLMKRLAPAWMLGVSLAIVIPAGCASSLAYSNIANDYMNMSYELGKREQRLDISQANLDRAKKNLAIPPGCPEEKIQGWDGELRNVCHGCDAHKYYSNANAQKIVRNGETMYCPTAAQLQPIVKANQESYDALHGNTIGALVKGVVFLLIAGLFWLSAASGVVYWRIRNKKEGAAASKGLAPQAPAGVQAVYPQVAFAQAAAVGPSPVVPAYAVGYAPQSDPRYAQQQLQSAPAYPPHSVGMRAPPSRGY